jgi:hypothetical protein
MRTTLTLDDDVAAALQRLRKTRDVGLKELVNDVLRRGLKNLSVPPKRREPFRTQSVSLGRALLPNVDNVAESLAIAEAEAFK